ncbi:MAG TPA: PadR family transcriptional regulator [Candidatus Limnocylindria bacterium]|jgi:DNA-binding PadR family transcriptional regulator
MPRNNAKSQALSPFAAPALLVLATLADGPKHGYVIMQEAQRMSGQPLGPGTLYAALVRLERRGLIEPLPAEERRRPYRLTALGATTLQAHVDQMRSFAHQTLRRLEGGAA